MAAVGALIVPLGMTFGVAAREAGISAGLAVVMSVTVMAGASQFAVLELWGSQIPLVPLVMVTAAVNARHVLMGASLHPWLECHPRRTRLLSLAFLSDANYADLVARRERATVGMDYFVGGGLVLWATWTLGTWLGAGLEGLVQDPSIFGLDVLMATFFVGLLPGAWEGRRSTVPWLVAALATWGSLFLLPEGWYPIVGATAGGLVGIVNNGD